jgi:hypothetical protein
MGSFRNWMMGPRKGRPNLKLGGSSFARHHLRSKRPVTTQDVAPTVTMLVTELIGPLFESNFDIIIAGQPRARPLRVT